MSKEFFPPRPESRPTIYAYEDTNPQYEGLLKVGYTTVDVQSRVAQQYPTKKPGKPPYRIVVEESAMRGDGSGFTDHDVHRYLRLIGIKNPEGEWFRCTAEQVKAALIAVRSGQLNEENRSLEFKMRPEQEAAVEKTMSYFKSICRENRNKPPHFLWNAKMRFGKTFAAYQLAKKMGWRKVLVLTFKPAVLNAWEEDLKCHIDFPDWQFISKKPDGLSYEEADKKKPFVCFGSFQAYLGRNTSTGGIKTKNEWVHATNWDCVILDEYHYGAWRENAKELFEAEDEKEVEFGEGEGIEYFDEEIMPISVDNLKLGAQPPPMPFSDVWLLNVLSHTFWFLPVLAYDGSSMKQIDAAGILDMAMSGTTATLLARRWESALLVNVDNDTLRRLMDNPKAMEALMSIEGFRNLNHDIETIINKSEAVKKARKEANDETLSAKEKKELTDAEKEYKSKRKVIQEKLIKFATRVPIFMYLTDFRERCLKDVITQLEPGLFKKVTGLSVNDFELLVSMGVFNSALMNDAVYKFKRYEDASLSYTGINKHEGEDIGLYDTVLSRNDYQATFFNEAAQAYQGTKQTQ